MAIHVAAGRALYALRSGTLTRIDAGGAVSPPPAGFTDDFNRANGPIGNGWTTPAGGSASSVISNNAAVGSAPFTNGGAVRDLGNANGTITMTQLPVGSGQPSDQAGIIFRYTDDNNHWRFYGGALRRVQGGVVTEVMPGISNHEAPAPKTVILNGSSITVSPGQYGQSSTTITDAFNSTATKHGIFHGHATPAVDSFTFTP